MSTYNCSHCGSEVSEGMYKCPQCGVVFTDEKGRFDKIIGFFESKTKMNLTGNAWKTLGWFGAANAAVILSITLISGGSLFYLTPFLLIIGSVFPLLSLLFSKYLAKKAHGIRIIQKGHFHNGYEADLYELVERLGKRAGLNETPEVGLYESEDMNAFATGMNRNNSMVAFSTGLLTKMSEEEIAAVAAHEMGHIANGDMITMSIVQSAVNAFVLLITIPLYLAQFFSFFSENVGLLAYVIISAIRFLVTGVLMFLGNLIVKAFSRKREYEADTLAARLISRDSMISALKTLSMENTPLPKGQKDYAVLKINAPAGLAEIFSTHPSLEKRIQRLQSLKD